MALFIISKLGYSSLKLAFGLSACLILVMSSHVLGYDPTAELSQAIVGVVPVGHTEVDKPLVAVNGDTIYASHLDESLMKFHSTLDQSKRTDFDYRALLDKLVEDYLIQQDSYALGIYEEPWLLDKLHKYRIKNARDMFLKDAFRPDLTIASDKILEFFNSRYFKMQIRTVAVDSLGTALQVIDDIKNGAAMDSIALAISFDSKRHKGGLHELIHYANTENAFRDVASKMEIGQLAEPIPYSDSYIVLRLEHYLAPNPEELPYYEDQIRRSLSTEKQHIKWDQFIDSLRELYPPVIFADAVERVQVDSLNLFTEGFVKGDGSVLFRWDDDHAVTDNNLRKEISYAAMSDRSVPYDSLFDRCYNGLETEWLLNYAAAHNGYMDSLSVVKAYYASLDSAAIEIYLSEVIVSQITFNREAFETYYNEHLEDFRGVDRFQIAQIQFLTKDSADLFHSRLNDGAQFEYLFEQTDPDNNSGSESEEWVTLDNFPEDIQATLGDMNINQHSEAYQTSNGWIILFIKNRKQGRIKSIEEVDKELRSIMFKINFDEAFSENQSLLRENAEIIYFDDNIREYFK